MMPKKFVLEKVYRDRYGDKGFYILSELIISEDKRNDIKFSIEELVTRLGLKVRRGKDGVNKEIKQTIKLMIDDNMIFTNDDINVVKVGGLIRCTLGDIYEINDSMQKVNWFALDIKNYLKILNDTGNLSKFILINIYFYILARIVRRNDNISNIRITGGKAEVFWDSQDFICEELGLSKRTLNIYIKHLQQMKLICYGNIGRLTKNNKIKKANNVYAENEEELKDGLKQSLYYWENQGWELIENKIKN